MVDLEDLDLIAPADSLYSGGVKINLIRTRIDALYTVLSDITAAEANQVENMASTTISAAQWAYVGALDQGLTTTSTVTFGTINAFTLGGKLTAGAVEIEGSAFDINGGTIDGCDVNVTGKTLTLDDNEISGDKVEGGTIAGITITALTLDYIEGTTEITINEAGNDVDFRVEGSGAANALFVQGSNGYVGIGNASPGAGLHVGDGSVGPGVATGAEDVFIEGKLEVEGNLRADGLIECVGGIQFNTSVTHLDNHMVMFGSSEDARLMWDTNWQTNHSLHLVLGYTSRTLIITDFNNRFKNCDLANQSNPTVFLFSATNPDITNNQWFSTVHDQQGMVITTGAQVGAGTGIAQACTATNATNLFTDVAHILSDDDRIMIGGDAVPTGVDNTVIYFVISETTDTFQISLTSGGAAVTFSDDGTNVTWSYASDNYISFAPRGVEALKITGAGNIEGSAFDINGGTIGGITFDGALTMSLGSDADGDIYYRASNKLARLAKGTEDYVLTMGAAVPEWAVAAGGNGGIDNVVEDTTPQLGGELDCQAHTIGFTQQTATGDGETTISWILGNKFYFTFGAMNEELIFDPAPTHECNLLLVLKQDGVGSRTAVWPNTVKWPSGTAPTLSTGVAAVDIVSFYWDGTNYHGSSLLDFSVPV